MRRVLVVLILLLLPIVASAAPLRFWSGQGGFLDEVWSELIDTVFTPATGIEVDLLSVPMNDMQQKLIMSFLDQDPPDLVKMQPYMPIEFAMRGVILDLNEFGEQRVADLIQDLPPGLLEQLRYGRGLFAVPEEVSWPMLFYRTDLFSDMGIAAPQTWDEFYGAVSRLRARGMNAYSWFGDPETMIFPLVFQRDTDIYSVDGTRSNLDDPRVIDAFRQLTGFYTVHKMVPEENWFNAFRDGSVPLQIGGAWQYSALESAAPDLRERWRMQQLPGLPGPNGLNRATLASPLVLSITKGSKRHEDVFKLMQWMMKAETQILYQQKAFERGNGWRLVMTNQIALAQAPFPEADRAILVGALETARSQRSVVGGLTAWRYVRNAFYKVILTGEDPEVAIRHAARESTAEMERKRREFARFMGNLQ